MSDFRMMMTRLVAPRMVLLPKERPFLTMPLWGEPPMGVMRFLAMSDSVVGPMPQILLGSVQRR